MLAKTSTACNETQEILEYNSHAIRLHSESMTPNVLYGDLFSTVNQICMTQESTGMTRIKCFAEVKFKKSILWSSRIEASAMEGCGLYYKELLRQLLEIDSLNSLETHVVRPIVVRSNTADNSHPNQLLHPPTITANSTCVNTTKYQATTAVMRRSFSHGSISTSPAHSLLSQHYMRNSSATFTSTQGATALVDFSAKKFTENSESVSLSAVNKSVTTIWTRIIQFSTDMLSKPLSTATTITQEQHIEPTSLEIEDQGDTKSNTGETQTSATLIIPDDVVALPSDVSKMPIKKLIHSEDCTNASSTFVQVCDSSPTKSEVQEKNRILWLIFVIVMAMSVMNLWQLFRTVSSIADIMHNNYQDRLLTTKPVRQLDWKTNFAYRPSQGSVQRETTQFHLMPLQIQADILRTEMEDLMFVLQTIKTLYT
ncbi:hypothetical protein FBU30_003982 [Linnemannia zychae]|nr:hypothetical protein FBU30_003982 [Linnemannia zychae]